MLNHKAAISMLMGRQTCHCLTWKLFEVFKADWMVIVFSQGHSDMAVDGCSPAVVAL